MVRVFLEWHREQRQQEQHQPAAARQGNLTLHLFFLSARANEKGAGASNNLHFTVINKVFSIEDKLAGEVLTSRDASDSVVLRFIWQVGGSLLALHLLVFRGII